MKPLRLLLSLAGLIPLPQKLLPGLGAFHLTRETRIYADPASQPTAALLADRLRRGTGYPVPIAAKPAPAGARSSITLTVDAGAAPHGPEAYQLDVTAGGVVLHAPAPAGLFYGTQTLLQLLPPAIFAPTPVAATDWAVPAVQITDWPRFAWRGFMLDVSRHFFTAAEVETVLDQMARLKLNRFHWHLVDDPGWRIAIQHYPLLTAQGAWRTKLTVLDFDPREVNAHPDWAAVAATKFAPDGRYGGFYTQGDIRAVVAYAAARHITVVPEIEMPGHSLAALTTYPQYGGTNASGAPNGIYDPANPETFTFLENILSEVFALFPGPYIHIGGDEVDKTDWNRSPADQALTKRLGLKDAEALQGWFIRRIARFVSDQGKTLVGWSEIAQGGLAPNAVVMDWIGGSREAAAAGHDVVMAPLASNYFDLYQSVNHPAEPLALHYETFLPLFDVYQFDPISADLPAASQAHILGAQANLWTELVGSLAHIQYMMLPRLTALAEVDWSAKDARDWTSFQERLTADEQRLDAMGVNYRHRSHAEIKTPSIAAQVSLDYPGFEGLSVDSLGQKRFHRATIKPPRGRPVQPMYSRHDGSRVEYRGLKTAPSAPARWTIAVSGEEIRLESHWTESDPPEPFEFIADTKDCHVTLLGRIQPDSSVQLPAVMHWPDQGSFRVEASAPAALGFTASEDRHEVAITFPGATAARPDVSYVWRVAAIHPAADTLKSDPRFDAFRRDWLNIFQLSPQWRMLANHSGSDTCAFCYYEYGDIARETPPLAPGLTALDLVGQTLDRIIAGAGAYGMPGHGQFPEFASDTLPSLLIASADYVQGDAQGASWLEANYSHLRAWTEQMLATDHEGNGLIEYGLSGNSGSWPEELVHRPANWWDTVGFGHEDAYSNALAYRALRGMSDLAQRDRQTDDAQRYAAAAARIKAAYYRTFYNPQTGVLAGWRSSDGQLHDYYFPWVTGIAIDCGLVSRDQGNALLDHLLAKIQAVGYARFDLGLPGNLVPVARTDYVDHNPRWGGGHAADNRDGFQIYENGGATACFEYFTLAALYDLGRISDGDRMLLPLLGALAAGDFQGTGANGMTKDWKTWNGTPWGYEGFLTDNYYVLLAVQKRTAALSRRRP